MIIQFNPNKLCKQAFFMEIVNYLYLNQPVTLRAIKREFPFQKNIDKLIEEFVKAGYIERFETVSYTHLDVYKRQDLRSVIVY